MSYVRSIQHTLTFDGASVTAVLRPLEVIDSIKLKNSYGDGKSNDEVLLTMAALLPKYVESFAGLNDAAGVAVPVDEVCRVAYFMPIVISCMNRLASESALKNPTPSVEG